MKKIISLNFSSAILLMAFIFHIVCFKYDQGISSGDILTTFSEIWEEELQQAKSKDIAHKTTQFIATVAKKHHDLLSDLDLFREYIHSILDHKNDTNEGEKIKYKQLLGRLADITDHLLNFSHNIGPNVDFLQLDGYFFVILKNFAEPKSDFQDYPEFFLFLLYHVVNIIKSFMNAIGTKNNSSIPCIFLDTIEAYFQPTLFYRLNRIEAYAINYSEPTWYSRVHEIFNDPFNPDGYAKNDINYLRCVPEDALPELFGKCLDTYRAGVADIIKDNQFRGQWINTTCGFGILDIPKVRDYLGLEDKFYYGFNGSCAIDYFALVRQRLEMHFGAAYNNVQPFCEGRNSISKHFKGSGWLTVKVVAAQVAALQNPYVDFTVHYGKGKEKKYTLNIKQNGVGWKWINETIRFDRAPYNASIQIQMWKRNKKSNPEKMYEESMALPSMVDRTFYESSTTNWKLFIVSIWRDDFGYNLHYPFTLNDTSREN